LSQAAARNPVVLIGAVVVFVIVLGLGGLALNNAVNPPPAGPTPSASVLVLHPCPSPPGNHPVAHPVRTFAAAPAMQIDPTKSYTALMCTSKGLITINLLAADAPLTVNNFVFLANDGFFDGLDFHRVCPNAADQSCGGGIKIAQGGDPLGNGTGGPGYKFNDEPVKGAYDAGTLAMANSGANTNGSQFFINTGANSFPPNYNLFGRITAGLDTAQALVKGDKILWVDIETAGATPGAAGSPSAGATPSAAASASPETPGPTSAPSPSPSPAASASP